MRDDREKLQDILEAIEKIEKRTQGSRCIFEDDEMLQVWVLYHIQIIGEAAGRISDTLQIQYQNIPWSDIVAMRNVIIHHYFGIDLDQIWDTVTNDLPALNVWVMEILAEF
ncbi:MAG: HepT-like ribonuclease domain-containing protein [Armatimonadota bacterium]